MKIDWKILENLSNLELMELKNLVYIEEQKRIHKYIHEEQTAKQQEN